MTSLWGQISSYILLFVASVMTIAAILNDAWLTEERTATNLNVLHYKHRGLWKECDTSPDMVTCYPDKDVFFGRTEFVAGRAMMVFGLLLQIVSMCLLFCTLLAGPEGKRKMKLASGILATVAAILIVSVGVMMFVTIGVEHKSKTMRTGNGSLVPWTETFGPGVFLATAAGIISLVVGGLMTSQGCKEEAWEEGDERYMIDVNVTEANSKRASYL